MCLERDLMHVRRPRYPRPRFCDFATASSMSLFGLPDAASLRLRQAPHVGDGDYLSISELRFEKCLFLIWGKAWGEVATGVAIGAIQILAIGDLRLLLGIAQWACGSCLIEMADSGIFGFTAIGRWEQRLTLQLRTAWLAFKQFATHHALHHSQPVFTLGRVNRSQGQKDFATLKAKAANMIVIMFWLASLATSGLDPADGPGGDGKGLTYFGERVRFGDLHRACLRFPSSPQRVGGCELQ